MPGSQNGKPAHRLISRRMGYLALTLILILAGLGAAVALAVGNPVTNITVTPSPLKIGNTAMIRYTLAQAANVTVEVLTETGSNVITVADNVYKLAGLQTVTWDNRDSAGQLIADGNYRIVVIAKDSEGTELGRLEKPLLAARVPVITNVTNSPVPYNPAGGQLGTVNYTLASDSLVTITIVKGTTTVKTLATRKPVPAGTASETWNGTNSQGVQVPDGSYSYQIKAESPTVLSFSSTTNSTVDVESLNPTITSYSVNPNPLKLVTNNATIRYTLSEDANVTLKVYDSSNNVVRTVMDGVAKPAGANLADWDGKKDNGAYVAEGNYNIIISAVDKYNKNSGAQTASLVCAFQPTASAVTVTPSPYNPADPPGSLANINYTLSNDALVTIQIMKGIVPVATLVNQQAMTAGSKTATWDGMSGGTMVGDDTYTLQITTVSPTVASFSGVSKTDFAVETGAPVVSNFSVTPNPFKLGTSLSIKYTLSEDCNVTIDVCQGETVIKNLLAASAKPVGANTTSWDGKDTSGANVPEGSYSIRITAVDAFNKSVAVQEPLTVGNAPAVTISDDPDPFDPTGGAISTISYTLGQDAKVTVTILKGTTVLRTLTSGVTQNAETHQVTWDGMNASQPAQQVGDGQYTYKVEAESLVVSAIKTTAEGVITVEAANPTVSSISVSPSIVKIGNNATLRYSISEAGKVSFKVVDSQNQVITNIPDQDKTAAGIYSLTWDTKDSAGNLIPNGTYKLQISMVDPAGKTGSGDFTFQASRVPEITNATATPATIDLSAGSTTSILSFNMSQESLVTLRLYDSLNKLVKTPYSFKQLPAGQNSVTVNVYENNKLISGPVKYTIDAKSLVGSFPATQVVGTIGITGTLTEPPPPPTEVQCNSCHNTYPASHPVTNCGACHDTEENPTTRPIGECASCHPGFTHGTAEVAKYDCTFCHNEVYPSVPGHGDISTLHQTPIASECTECHQGALDVEHPLHKDVNGNPYDCNTCHQSTVAGVVYAIDNGLKDCSACHTIHVDDHDPSPIGTDCTSCHKVDIVQEHLDNPTTQTDVYGEQNPWTCNTCHNSTEQTVVGAIYAGDTNCTTCHTGPSHESLHVTTELDSNCTTCHINSLTQEHMNNPKTQIDPLTGLPRMLTCDTCHKSTATDVVGAIATDNKQCAACHQTAHNINLVEKVPADIPLYPTPDTAPALTWSQPLDASFWAGESWMPDEFLVGGKVVISSRSTDALMTGDAVYAYYSTKLVANGWTLASEAPAAGSNFFNVTFTKGTIHKAVVWFYGGSAHNAEPVVTAGYRVEIVYK